MANALRKIEDNDNEAGTDIVVQVNDNPGLVLLDQQRFDQFYEAIKAETDRHVPDLTSEKGRAAIKALAFKVTKTKTAIDAAGKLLKEEAQKTVNTVDAARRTIKTRLEALAVEVREPLTKWEEAEDARLAGVKESMERFRLDAIVSTEETAADVEARLSYVRGVEIDPAVFVDWTDLAKTARGDAIASLERALERIRREEADRAELERLRAEASARAERERAEAEAKAAAEAAERQRAEYVAAIMQHITDCGNGMIGGSTYPYPILVRELEEKIVNEPQLEADWERIDAHRSATLTALKKAIADQQAAAAADAQKIEADRIAAAAKAAKDAARADAERKANEERVAAERAHAEALAAEKRRADEAEAARKAQEAQALAAKQAAEREAEAKRKADEARAADQQHRASIMGKAKVAIMGMGVGEQAAIGIVRAIAAGDVPNVSIRF